MSKDLKVLVAAIRLAEASKLLFIRLMSRLSKTDLQVIVFGTTRMFASTTKRLVLLNDRVFSR